MTADFYAEDLEPGFFYLRPIKISRVVREHDEVMVFFVDGSVLRFHKKDPVEVRPSPG